MWGARTKVFEHDKKTCRLASGEAHRSPERNYVEDGPEEGLKAEPGQVAAACLYTVKEVGNPECFGAAFLGSVLNLHREGERVACSEKEPASIPAAMLSFH